MVTLSPSPMTTKSTVATSFYDSRCANPLSMESLNDYCFCVSADPSALHAALASILDAHGVPATLAETHPHLFAAVPVYVSRQHLVQVEAAVTAIEAVTGLPAWREAVLAWAPKVALHDPGSPGGLLGLDFHLTPEGPRLIEINTNPGGILMSYSCSGGIGQELFQKIVAGAAIDAGVDARILYRLSAAPHHPLGLAGPEGE